MSEPIILTCLSCGQVNRVPLTRLNAGPKCARCKALLVDGDVAEIDERVHEKAVKTVASEHVV